MEQKVWLTDGSVDGVIGRKIFAINEDFIICNISDEDRSNYVELRRQLKG